MLKFLLIFCLFIISLSFASRILLFYHFHSQNLFLLDLLGIQFKFPLWFFYLSSIGSFYIFTLISLKIFPHKFRFYPPFIFAISPWFAFLTVAQSFYIYILFLLLAAVYGLILAQSHQKLGVTFFVIASILSIYSSLTIAISYPIFLIFSVLLKLVDKKIIKLLLILIPLCYLPLLIIANSHRDAWQNISRNQITIFANPGLLAQSNRLQGDAKKEGYITLARLAENKYFYLSKYMIFKELKHFTPSTYFTPQEKLLNFSFTPPIYLGFLIPFAVGFYTLLTTPNWRKYLWVLPIFTIPSFLSQPLIDLNRLVIIGSVIIWLISLGFIKKNKIMLIIVALLVLSQLLFTIADMNLREDLRYHKYFEDNLLDEIGRQ